MIHRRELIAPTCYSDSVRMNMYLFIILSEEKGRIIVQEIGVKWNKIVYWQIQWDKGL